MNVNLDKIIASVAHVKLKGGVFGRSVWLGGITAICFTSIAIFVRPEWLCLALCSILSLFVLIIFCLLMLLAAKQPQVAILEGAEFLAHQQMQLGAKGIDVLDNKNGIPETPLPFLPDTPNRESEVIDEAR